MSLSKSVGAVVLLASLGAVAAADTPLAGEMIVVKDAARPQTVNHAAAIIELPNGDLLCLWNRTPANKLGHADIVSSRLPFGGSSWTSPRTILSAPNKGYINPSLCFDRDNVLWLFYSMDNESWLYMKADGTPNDANMRNSCMYYRKSFDYGETWGEPNLVRGRMNTDGRGGYLTGAKPILLRNGNLLVSAYRDFGTNTPAGYTAEYTDSVGLVTADRGRTFSQSNAIHAGLSTPWISMPSVQPAADGTILAWYRTPSGVSAGKMFRGGVSADGLTWAQPSIPSNSPDGSQARVDTLKLESGKFLMACTPGGRREMRFLLSSNDGATWEHQRVTDALGGAVTVSPGVYTGTVAYPSVIQSRDGLIHAVYTFDGYHQLKHVVLSEAWIAGAATSYKPSIGLTYPINGAYLTSTDVTLQAVALDRDGVVAKVEFFEGATKLGEQSGAPYTCRATFAPGVHHVSARATDTSGKSTTSATIRFVVAAESGSLTGGVASGGSGSVNLSDEGTSDWIHLGLGNTPGAVNRKSGSGLLQVEPLGQTATRSYVDSPVKFSWSGGTPAATAASTSHGVYIDYMGSGFEVSAPADTRTRRLKLYVGTYLSRGRCDAWLSDGSAARFVDASIESPGGARAAVVTLDYRAASAGQTLTVRFMQDYNFASNSFPGVGNVGNVALQAAALSLVDPAGGDSGGSNGSSDDGGGKCGLLGGEILGVLGLSTLLRRTRR